MGLNTRPTLAATVAIGVIAIAGVQIWLRGYLLPGTPTLSARYFPPWVLRAFGKEPFVVDGTRSESGIDTERPLAGANAVRFGERTAYGTLEDTFADEWQAAIEDLASVETTVVDVFDVDGAVQIDERGNHVILTLDGRPFGRWVSRAALLADLGAGRVLASRYDGWGELETAERGQVLAQLRRYIDACPACAGEAVSSLDSATSCCREYEVVTVSCSDCGTRLSEVPVAAVDEHEAVS
ncbi:hypothetical protein [Halorhabdus tiamatea]|uniref:Uncharacterized protein n=1 Tax=Halorhabdus tiamatea SARL4B TaxID=1033806 RepID=S6CVX2_9EURY|nr:hypothetical protein [Halorhabdus tiamatea]CCQ34817.1 conserved hypothetical protein [Halorhabdus tiamatea SARL4B]